MAFSQSLLNQVQELYIAFYDRPADLGGLQYWAGVVTNDYNGNVQGILQDFANSPESQNLYGTITSSNVGAVINQIYFDLFNRGVDPTGLQYWTNAYNTYHMSAGELAYDILNGAQGTDTTTIYNKLMAANVFTQTEGNNYTSALIPTASSFINAVTSTTDLTQITPSSVSSYTQSFQTSTYNLTTGVDTLVGSNPVNDVFNGAYTTWTPGDSITGAQGANNTLNLGDNRTAMDFYVSSSYNPWNLNPVDSSVSGVQNVNVASQTAVSIDTTKWTGVTNLTIAANDYNLIYYVYGNSTVTAAPTTNINFTDSNLNSYTDKITGGKNVVVNESNVSSGIVDVTGGQNVTINASNVNGGKINVYGLNGTQSVSVTQSLASSSDASVASVIVVDFNSVGGNFPSNGTNVYTGFTPTTPSLGTITNVTLDGTNYGAEIYDNNLQTLTVNNGGTGTGFMIYDNSAISGIPNALTLNVSNDGSYTHPIIIRESDQNPAGNKGQYTTLNVVTGAKPSDLSLAFNAATALNVSGNSVLTLSSSSTSTLPALSTVSISGAAGFTAVNTNTYGAPVAVLPATLTSITDSSSGVVNVVLPTNATNTNLTTASFNGSTATGQEIVTITQPVSASIQGGTATNNELVISTSSSSNNFATSTTTTTTGAINSLGTGTISGFEVLGINDSNTTGYSFDIAALGAQLGSFNNTVDLQQVQGTDTLYNLANNSTLQFDDVNNIRSNVATYGKITAQFAGTSGATDTANVVFNHTLNDGIAVTVNSLTLQDSATTPNGIGTLNITDTTVANLVNNPQQYFDFINALTDNSLTTLNINSNNAFAIGALNDNTTSPVTINLNGAAAFVILAGVGLSTPTLTINDNSTTTSSGGGSNLSGTTIGTLQDNALTSLNITATANHAFNISTITDNPTTALTSVAINLNGAGLFSLGTDIFNAKQLTITDNSTNPSATTIANLQDNGSGNLTTLNLAGSHSLTIDSLGTTGSNGITLIALTNINFSGSGTDTITNLYDNAATLAIANTGTGTASITNFFSASNTLTTLTLQGNVGLGTSITDSIGFTLAGATDNAKVNFTLIDTATTTHTNTIVLGNGNDTITLDSTSSTNSSSSTNYNITNYITVGTGTSTINLTDSSSSGNSVSDIIKFADNSAVFTSGTTPTHLTTVSFSASGSATFTDVSFDLSSVLGSTPLSFYTTAINETNATTLSAALSAAVTQVHNLGDNAGYFTYGSSGSTNTYFFADSQTNPGHEAIIALVGTVTQTTVSGDIVHIAAVAA